MRAALQQAAQAGARLVHFPEGALSGYVKSEIEDWAEVDWAALREELEQTAVLAKRLGVWVVLGANHRLRAPRWPQNSLYVISDTGVLAGRYSKRYCSNTEVTYWYTPGADPLAFDVDGVRFGCALCIEVVFPTLFAEYGAARCHVHAALVLFAGPDPWGDGPGACGDALHVGQPVHPRCLQPRAEGRSCSVPMVILQRPARPGCPA